MYTANTMGLACEILGLTLPNSSSNPANSIDKLNELKQIPTYMSNLMTNKLIPSNFVTRESFINAITFFHLLFLFVYLLKNWN